MKRLLAALSLSCVLFAADFASDDVPERAAAEMIVAAINTSRTTNTPKTLEALFAANLRQEDRTAILASEQSLCAEARRPMSEMMVPFLRIQDVRIIDPNVLELDAVNDRIGSIPPVSAMPDSVFLILRKEGASWRIASFRTYRRG